MIADSTIDKVHERVEILDVVQEFVELRRAGHEYVGKCPFHNERTGSFYVNPHKNLYYCHSCHAGGDAIKFIREQKGLDYTGAISFLAAKYNIYIEETEQKVPEEVRRKRERRETALTALQKIQTFFEEQLAASTSEAAKARDYAYNRWGDEYCRAMGIGYAPSDAEPLLRYIEEQHIPKDVLIELGIIFTDDDGKLVPNLRYRVTVPDRNIAKRIINFTARTLSKKKEVPKYKNLKDSLLYSKSRALFGIDVASSAGSKARKIFYLEGAPDVMRMQILGYNNAVGALGTAFTLENLETMKRICNEIVFIPDSDPPKEAGTFGAGINAVMKNGRTALCHGFKVKVKEIPLQYERVPDQDWPKDGDKAPFGWRMQGEEREGKDGKETVMVWYRPVKADVDSFITSQEIFNQLPEIDFIPWLAGLKFSLAKTQSEINDVIKDICELLAQLSDASLADIYIDQLANKSTGGKTAWKRALKTAKDEKRERETEKAQAKDKSVDQPPKNSGFFIEDNCYCTYDKDGEKVCWSNFIMIPFYDILAPGCRSRLFKIRNYQGEEYLVQFSPKEFGTLPLFREKLTNTGNLVWLAKIDELMKVCQFIFNSSKSATQVLYMGHQRQSVYAWGNGIHDYKKFYPADDFGMVDVPGVGIFYLPSCSPTYKDNEYEYPFEKQFIHTQMNQISLSDYLTKMISVFGENAKIGFAYVVATLFRDIIFKQTNFFPLLDVFGQKASGKSHFCMALRSFFIAENSPINIESQSFAACNTALGQCSNAVVHFDEYKNTISIPKLEMLKGTYDGVGRGKMNNGKIELLPIRCGVFLSGQELPTLDIALFTRCVLLVYTNTEFTMAARERFNEFADIRRQGVSHLTNEILECRARVLETFQSSYDLGLHELAEALGDEQVEDRIIKNWLVLLATVRCVEGQLKLPFTYQELFDLCVPMIIEQGTLSKTTNEVANFWEFVYVCFQEGKIWENGDFKILSYSSLKTDEMDEPISFPQPTDILFLRPSRLMALYQKEGNRSCQILMSKTNMRQYLGSSKGCFGKVRMKFTRMIDGVEQREKIPDNMGGYQLGAKLLDQERVYAFDYNFIKSQFGINLRASTDASESSIGRRGGEKPKATQEELPF